MKTKHSILKFIALAAMVMTLLGARPVAAAFLPGAEVDAARRNYFVQEFDDGNAVAFWVLNLGVVAYTVGLYPTGNWQLNSDDGKRLHEDGSLSVYWEQPTATGYDFALWIFGPTGQLIGAATYSVSGWNPSITDDSMVFDGKTLIVFDGTGANAGLTAAWLFSRQGVPLRTYLWANILAGGWALWTGPGASDAIFWIVYQQAVARLLTYYVFNAAGEWIAATTYSY